jgi:hypothetical protein
MSLVNGDHRAVFTPICLRTRFVHRLHVLKACYEPTAS